MWKESEKITVILNKLNTNQKKNTTICNQQNPREFARYRKSKYRRYNKNV